MNRSSEEFTAGLIELIPTLRRYCHALAGSAADADDLLQAGLERALARHDQFQPGTTLDRWMFRICRNIWIDEMRKKQTRGTVIEFDEQVASNSGGSRGSGSLTPQEAHLALGDVGRAMARLNEGHRSVLALIGVEGLSYKEAAKVLGLPVGTVMSRLARARSQLSELLEREEVAS